MSEGLIMNEAATKMRSAAVEMDTSLRQVGWAAQRMEEVADKMVQAAERFSDSVDKIIEHDRVRSENCEQRQTSVDSLGALHVTNRVRKK